MGLAGSGRVRVAGIASAVACFIFLTPLGYAPQITAAVIHNTVPNASSRLAQSGASNEKGSAKTSIDVPRGTILPIQLATSLSSAKSRPGQRITAKITQDVPLPSGAKIPKGSKVTGQVVAVTPAAAGVNAEISFRFDQLRIGSQTLSLTTNLRAIAGFMEVEDAQIPVHASGESEVYDWLPTRQIGGDDVFGRGGPVTKWNDSSQVVGKSLMDGGVLARINARPDLGCRGALYGNNAPQALWVFSSDACGVYGLPHVTIADWGRGEPAGLIVLRSSASKVNLPSGTGMLLRTNEAGSAESTAPPRAPQRRASGTDETAPPAA